LIPQHSSSLFTHQPNNSLANLSFSQGIFSDKIKHARVTPHLKNPTVDVDLSLSYRPTSNLNSISKILEKLFLARLSPCIFSSPNFNSAQSAYRKFHSRGITFSLLRSHISLRRQWPCYPPSSFRPKRCIQYNRSRASS
jgi:hypothetical protein